MEAVDCDKETGMSELVARTGRLRQRYLDGCRLIAGCIPFRYRTTVESNKNSSDQIVEVLMINSNSGPGLLFPKGGWEDDETVQEAAVREAMEEAGVRGDLLVSLGVYDFKSTTHEDEFSPEGVCKAEMFALHVKEELETWPEQSMRERTWLAVPEALGCCRHACGCARPWRMDSSSGIRNNPLQHSLPILGTNFNLLHMFPSWYTSSLCTLSVEKCYVTVET